MHCAIGTAQHMNLFRCTMHFKRGRPGANPGKRERCPVLAAVAVTQDGEGKRVRVADRAWKAKGMIGEGTELNVEQVKECIKLAYRTKSKRPLFLWGPPGCGKSSAPLQVAGELGIGFRDVRLPLLDPVDLRGIPSIVHNGHGSYTEWARPSFLPVDGEGILFLDEILLSAPIMQGAAYGLTLERRLGEYMLPDGWMVMAASNRVTDRAGVQSMLTPLRNRFTHLYLAVDLETWCRWAIGAGIAVEVLAFLRFRPALLFNFDPSRNEYAYCTPRSWEFVSDFLQAGMGNGIEYSLLAGTIGEGPAAEFLGFLKIWRKLQSPDAILLNPMGADVSSDPAVLYATVTGLARRASDQTIDRILQYAGRLPAEFGVLMVRDCIARDKSLTNTKAFITWASRNASVLV